MIRECAHISPVPLPSLMRICMHIIAFFLSFSFLHSGLRSSRCTSEIERLRQQVAAPVSSRSGTDSPCDTELVLSGESLDRETRLHVQYCRVAPKNGQARISSITARQCIHGDSTVHRL